MSDEFEEFDTPAEDILRVIREGEPVTFGAPCRVTITRSTWPIYGQTTTTNRRHR